MIASLKRLLLSDVWTATGFRSPELSAYAERLMTDEARDGITALSLCSLLLLSGAALLHSTFGMGASHTYTCLALAALSLHILIAGRSVRDVRVQYLLGTTLLVIVGVGLVLLAHQAQTFSAMLFASVALLFIVIPLVPWGLREASTVTLLIYGVFTASTASVSGRFDAETLGTLQFLMLSTGAVSLLIVTRAVSVRKHHVEARYALEQSQRELQSLSERDPLTGVWNRRALDERFPEIKRLADSRGEQVCFAVLDLDYFKQFNDTFGHRAGDELLQKLCRCLQRVTGPDELLVRIGGDEFVVVLRGDDAPTRFDQVAEAFRREIAAQTLQLKLPLGLSVGYVRVEPMQRMSMERMYECADAALYASKRSDRARVQEYDAQLEPKTA